MQLGQSIKERERDKREIGVRDAIRFCEGQDFCLRGVGAKRAPYSLSGRCRLSPSSRGLVCILSPLELNYCRFRHIRVEWSVARLESSPD